MADRGGSSAGAGGARTASAQNARAMAECFPRGFRAREAQASLLAKVEEAARSGYRHILACAPTGIGKSHVAVAFARWHGTSSIITAQKVLQDQYMRDFGFLAVAKGKSNYPCIALCESAGIAHEGGASGGGAAVSDKSATCGHGACTWKYDGEIKHCRYKPKMDEFRVGEDGSVFDPVADGDREAPGKAWAAMAQNGGGSADAGGGQGAGGSDVCYYYRAKYRAMLAEHSLYNYSAYLHFYRFGPDEMRRRCIVADEAHEIEDVLADYAACSIEAGELAAAGAHVPDVPDAGASAASAAAADGAAGAGAGSMEIGPDELLEALKLLAKYHTQSMRETGRGNGAAYQMHAVLAEKYGTIRTELKRNPANVACSARRSSGATSTRARWEGVVLDACILDVSWLARRLFDSPCQLYMSATIHPDVFCPAMGIDRRDCAYIEVDESPFRPENRPVHYTNAVRLNSSSGEADMAAAYSEVVRLLAAHPDEKGIVHTTSIRQCNGVCEAVGSARETIPVYGGGPMERDAALDLHAKSPGPTVLVSPGLWNGVDLIGDLSRFQIVLKAPYPSMADMRTRRMAAVNQLWYKYRAGARLIQGIGRSVRSEDDHAVTYVIDSSAVSLMRSLRKYVPQAYRDTLVPPPQPVEPWEQLERAHKGGAAAVAGPSEGHGQ